MHRLLHSDKCQRHFYFICTLVNMRCAGGNVSIKITNWIKPPRIFMTQDGNFLEIGKPEIRIGVVFPALLSGFTAKRPLLGAE